MPDSYGDCNQLLREISDLESELEQAINAGEKVRLRKEIQERRIRYDQLNCGSTDPGSGYFDNERKIN